MAITLVNRPRMEQFYTFSAASLPAAEQQMQRLGPRDSEGHHAAAFEARADIRPGMQVGTVPQTVASAVVDGVTLWSASARITQATFLYEFIYTYPRWSNVQSLPRAVQNEWNRFCARVRVHETWHAPPILRLLRNYLQQFQRLTIGGMGATTALAESDAQRNLRSQVDELMGILASETEAAMLAYDRRTVHGRTQGATLNTRIR